MQSVNPATGQILATFPNDTPQIAAEKLDQAQRAWLEWRNRSWEERREAMTQIAAYLRQQSPQVAQMMSTEMGKPLAQAAAEVEKSAWCAEYFAQEAEHMLAPQTIATDATSSQIQFRPLGLILGIMPWNYPLWQVIRAAVPAIMAGNGFILKHSSNVPQTAQLIAAAFGEERLPKGLFANLLVNSADMEQTIANPMVKAITLTGSATAGSSVAQLAGKHLKKTLLELGGSDAFVVMADADLATVVPQAVTARLQNNSQSCIAAKRFIVAQEIKGSFQTALLEALQKQVLGDPLDPKTTMGPLVSGEARERIHQQVTDSVQAGAQVVAGGTVPEGAGYFYSPTVMTNVSTEMPVWQEETFGPVFPLMAFSDLDELPHLINNTSYGLGASFWTSQPDQIKTFVPKIETGSVFINGMVKSDPRLPFGGVKQSGYGRELSAFGLKEFVNIQTFWQK